MKLATFLAGLTFLWAVTAVLFFWMIDDLMFGDDFLDWEELLAIAVAIGSFPLFWLGVRRQARLAQ